MLEASSIPAARLTAEVLLAHALGRDRAWLYAHTSDELPDVARIHFGRYLTERLTGKPTQYITHRQEFYGREFYVNADVLIPRPETEHVVECALEKLPPEGMMLDVGCGSGAIAITLALETGRSAVATDLSEAALHVAARNARQLRAPVYLATSDLLDAIAPRSVSLLVSNPPYVPSVDASVLQREVVAYEPHIALFGGTDGFGVYRRLIADAARVLRPGSWIIMETAYNGESHVRALLGRDFRDIEIRTDLAGLPRVILARLAG